MVENSSGIVESFLSATPAPLALPGEKKEIVAASTQCPVEVEKRGILSAQPHGVKPQNLAETVKKQRELPPFF
jgi:hypothetical protein